MSEESHLPPPLVLAFVICDDIIVDARTGKPSLIGVFNSIAAASFPCVHNRLWLYLALTEGYGQCDLDIRFINITNPTESLTSMIFPVHFKNPRQINEVHGQIERLHIPEEGEYHFSVHCRDHLLVERRFHATGRS